MFVLVKTLFEMFSTQKLLVLCAFCPNMTIVLSYGTWYMISKESVKMLLQYRRQYLSHL